MTDVQTAFASEVRWLNDKLQQRWEIIEYQDGRPSSLRFEWRDVPTVTEEEGP